MILSPTTKKHARGDRPHDDRGHAPEQAAADNGSAGAQASVPVAEQSPPMPVPAVATEVAPAAKPAVATEAAPAAKPATAAKPAPAAKRAPAAAKRASTAPKTTTNAAPKPREENAEDSNA